MLETITIDKAFGRGLTTDARADLDQLQGASVLTNVYKGIDGLYTPRPNWYRVTGSATGVPAGSPSPWFIAPYRLYDGSSAYATLGWSDGTAGYTRNIEAATGLTAGFGFGSAVPAAGSMASWVAAAGSGAWMIGTRNNTSSVIKTSAGSAPTGMTNMVVDGCYAYGRFWVLDGYGRYLRWSDGIDPTNFSTGSAGSLDLSLSTAAEVLNERAAYALFPWNGRMCICTGGGLVVYGDPLDRDGVNEPATAGHLKLMEHYPGLRVLGPGGIVNVRGIVYLLTLDGIMSLEQAAGENRQIVVNPVVPAANNTVRRFARGLINEQGNLALPLSMAALLNWAVYDQDRQLILFGSPYVGASKPQGALCLSGLSSESPALSYWSGPMPRMVGVTAGADDASQGRPLVVGLDPAYFYTLGNPGEYWEDWSALTYTANGTLTAQAWTPWLRGERKGAIKHWKSLTGTAWAGAAAPLTITVKAQADNGSTETVLHVIDADTQDPTAAFLNLEATSAVVDFGRRSSAFSIPLLDSSEAIRVGWELSYTDAPEYSWDTLNIGYVPGRRVP